MIQPLWRGLGDKFFKNYIFTTFGPAVQLLGTHPKDTLAKTWTGLTHETFPAALLTSQKTGSSPNNPPVGAGESHPRTLYIHHAHKHPSKVSTFCSEESPSQIRRASTEVSRCYSPLPKETSEVPTRSSGGPGLGGGEDRDGNETSLNVACSIIPTLQSGLTYSKS